jgi:2,4-dienoyl-CoA reductase-like NADH-dependent reductase (Old Yellow Enzyme family)
MALLFEPVTQRGVTFRNRTVVAPMCQYSARDGLANDWHLVHLGRFALGGFGMVMVEATGVTPEGRISWADVGLWNDAQVEALRPVTRFLGSQNTVSAIQLAHAGRKASTPVDWRRDLPAASESEQREAGFEHWQPVAPSAVVHAADNPDFQQPHALTREEIAGVVRAFADAARRADAAGFDMVEVHAAHGYLINQFLSPIANKRDDEYGGSRENRMRLVLEVTEAVRATLPQDKPVWVRISASDNAPGGWDVEDSVALARELKALGVDAIDCSSGGFAEGRIAPSPGYQVPFAHAIKTEAGIATAAVGLLHDAQRAEAIVAQGEADFIALARGALDDPNWPVHARHQLEGEADDFALWPVQAAARMRDRARVLARVG